MTARQVTRSLVDSRASILCSKSMGSTSFSQVFKEVEAKFILKGGGYLILPEQTRNVQGHFETMDFCSYLNPFALSVG